jgi:hypothetical protein
LRQFLDEAAARIGVHSISMTVQEYLDALAERLLMDAQDGTMPPAIKRQVSELLQRLQAEIDINGHVQTQLTPQELAMPWEEFAKRIDFLMKRN